MKSHILPQKRNFDHIHDKHEGKDIVIYQKYDGMFTMIEGEKYKFNKYHVNDNRKTTWLQGFIKFNFRKKVHEDITGIGEYLYIKNTIPYTNLPSYFVLEFLAYKDIILDSDDTHMIAKYEDFDMPEILYQGKYDRKIVDEIQKAHCSEYGILIRNKDPFDWNKIFDNCTILYANPEVRFTDPDWFGTAEDHNKIMDTEGDDE